MHRKSLLAVGAAMSALLVSAADAGSPGVGSGFRHRPLPPPINDGFLGFPGVYVVERVQIIEREVVKEAPPPPPPAEPAPPPPRKPYAIGETYSSLPSPCMKMIQDGASYYHCSGEWYRQVSGGKDGPYLAVAAP